MEYKYEIMIGFIVFITLMGIMIYNIKRAELNAKKMSLIGMFAALMTVGAYVKLPLFMLEFTFQLFFCIFAGLLLGSRLGMISMMVYTLVGLIGVPVFSRGGGFGYVFQSSFGYILGFILGAFVTGKVVEIMKKDNFLVNIMASLTGVGAIYLVGVPYLYIILNLYLTKGYALDVVVGFGFFQPIIGDLILSIVASKSVPSIKGALKKSNLTFK
ncbi:biotin transporter BioY [Vallitalea sediminicola]